MAHPSKHQLLVPALSLDPSWVGPAFPPGCSEVLVGWHCEPGALGYPLAHGSLQGEWKLATRKSSDERRCCCQAVFGHFCCLGQLQGQWGGGAATSMGCGRPERHPPSLPRLQGGHRPALALRAAPSQQRLPGLVSMPQLSAVPPAIENQQSSGVERVRWKKRKEPLDSDPGLTLIHI